MGCVARMGEMGSINAMLADPMILRSNEAAHVLKRFQRFSNKCFTLQAKGGDKSVYCIYFPPFYFSVRIFTEVTRQASSCYSFFRASFRNVIAEMRP